MATFNFWAIPYNEDDVTDNRFEGREFEGSTIEEAYEAAWDHFEKVAPPFIVRSVGPAPRDSERSSVTLSVIDDTDPWSQAFNLFASRGGDTLSEAFFPVKSDGHV